MSSAELMMIGSASDHSRAAQCNWYSDVLLVVAVDWRPKGTSRWRLKRYQLKHEGICCPIVRFCIAKTYFRGTDGKSTWYG